MAYVAAGKTDYVIGTGEQHSVEDFLSIAFNHVGLNFKDFVKIDKDFLGQQG